MKWLPLLLLACMGCASVSPDAPPTRHILLKQILAPRAGYKTLTNQVCLNYSKDGHCEVETVEYDLNDQAVRDRLADVEFRCRINGEIFYICRNKPGFCHRGYDILKKFGPFVTSRKVHIEYIDINERYQFLLDSKTRCRSAQRLRELK